MTSGYLLPNNLLEIDPENLLENHPVSAVESVLHNVNNEIERRRVELRTLVGERYRDLIEAADKIDKMKVLSVLVIKDVESLNKNVSLIDRGAPKADAPLKIGKPSGDEAVAAGAWLLVELPERIWSAIESGSLADAARLYLLGRHLKTGFSVDASLQNAPLLMKLLDHQWKILSHFPDTILDTIRNQLVQPSLSPQECCELVVAMGLLEQGCLLSKLLSCRLTAIEINTHSDSQLSAMNGSYEALLSTLSAVSYAFIEGEEVGDGGQVWSLIDNLCGRKAVPIIDLFGPNPSLRHLPPTILHFRGSVGEGGCGRLSIETVRSAVSNWLVEVRHAVGFRGKILLDTIPTLKALTTITVSPLKESSLIKESVDIGEIDLWAAIYRPLILERGTCLITLQWAEIIKTFTNNLRSSFSNTHEDEEVDLRWHIWKESPADLSFFQDFKGDFSEARNKESGKPRSNKSGVWLKCGGVSPKVEAVCSQMEASVTTLESSVNSLCVDGGPLGPLRDQLVVHHHQAATLAILRLKEFVGDYTSEADVNEARLLAIARVLSVLLDLAPSLHSCLAPPQSKEVRALLVAESIRVWNLWVEYALERRFCSPHLPGSIFSLSNPSSYSHLLQSIPQWEAVKVEQGDGHCSSELRVPLGPSLPLICFLLGTAHSLNRTLLPRVVYESLFDLLLNRLIKRLPSHFLCQTDSLQTLFDARFLYAHLNNPSKEVSEQCQAKIKEIEGTIDPFDLDMYSEHIRANIRFALSSTQCLLAGGKDMNAAYATSTRTHDDPSIVALSHSAPQAWFPPLPVANPSSKPLHLKKPKISKTSTRPTDSTDSLMKATTVASSFFNEWFS